MKIAFGSASLLLVLCPPLFAGERDTFAARIEFECSGAQVIIESSPKGFRSPEEAYVATGRIPQAELVVVRGDARAVFQGWSDINYIWGGCAIDAKGHPHIVYRVNCGGSGCRDSRWGIVDAISLRELLRPTGENTARATEILGAPPPPVHRWVSLLAP